MQSSLEKDAKLNYFQCILYRRNQFLSLKFCKNKKNYQIEHFYGQKDVPFN